MSIEDDAIKFKKFCANSFNYELALEESKITQCDVNNFKEILKSHAQVPKALMDRGLLLFLTATDNDVEKSVSMITKYCKMISEIPEWWSNRDVQSKEVQSSLDNQVYVSLPATPENYNLILHKAISFEPKDYVFDDAEKTFLITIGNIN